MTTFTLEQIITQDNLVHEGIFAQPDRKGNKAVLWIHGLSGKFYSHPKQTELFAEQLGHHGIGFAAFNSRGHDFVTSTNRLDASRPRGYVYETIGAGVERFTDCIHDIDAAVSFLAGKGFTRVILIGHSTGANKACFYAGTHHDSRIAGIVLAGPMSDRYSATDAETNAKHRAIMEQKIREGNGDELLTGYDFFPLTPNRWMSLLAEGSPEDVFNYHDDTNALATFSRINVPLLVVFGEMDEHADRPIPDMKNAFDAHAASPHYGSIIIPGADHSFTGKEKEFIDVIVDWVRKI